MRAPYESPGLGGALVAPTTLSLVHFESSGLNASVLETAATAAPAPSTRAALIESLAGTVRFTRVGYYPTQLTF